MLQIGKLRSELEMVNGNVRVMSEMLTELVPNQAEPADLELLLVRGSRPRGSASPPPHSLQVPGWRSASWSHWGLLTPRTPSDWTSGLCHMVI